MLIAWGWIGGWKDIARDGRIENGAVVRVVGRGHNAADEGDGRADYEDGWLSFTQIATLARKVTRSRP